MQRDIIILVVDDDESVFQFISVVLQDFGQIIYAHDGEEALEKIANWDIDVIISDIDMPRLDGVELLKILKQEQKIPTPVIIISGVGIKGLSPAESVAHCLKLDAFDYLDKADMTLEKLRNVVRRALESRVKNMTDAD
jgi:CheY-like chemotaxis protein